MLNVANFNPDRDIREVDQFGYVDLHNALATGVLPASVPASEAAFDAVSGAPLSPSQIVGVPSDVFDAMEMRDNLRKAAAAADADAAAKQSAASTISAAATE